MPTQRSPRQKYWLAAAIVVVALAATVALISRFAVTKTDRLIENNLMLLQARIDNYATDHKKLPASPQDLDLRAEVYAGVRDMLAQADVSYTPDVRPAEKTADGTKHYYQLCATFKRAKAGSGGYDHSPYLYPLGHPAGRHCYSLRISTY